MCVSSARQRQGIGSALVRAGLDAVCEAGYQAVFVVRHIGYYPGCTAWGGGLPARRGKPLDEFGAASWVDSIALV